MNKALFPLQFLWRLWFFVAVFLSIFLVFPFITIFSLRTSWYRHFFVFARIWAYAVLLLSGFWPRVIHRSLIDRKKTYIIIANHTSMIDIMMTYVAMPNVFLFIGKKELGSWPLFGYYYRKTNILVDRNSLASKRDVFHEARKKLKEGIGVCIYPEGGVPKQSDLLAPFKVGAFKLAAEEQIEILPITFPDNKRHFPYSIWGGGYPGVLRAVIHEPIPVGEQSEKILRDQAYHMMFAFLNRHSVVEKPGRRILHFLRKKKRDPKAP